jgi:Uma2 family endonuclease
MSTAATTIRRPLLTSDDLAQLPADVGYELDRGVLVEMSRPKPRHGLIATNLILLIGSFVKTNRLGRVFTESGFILARNPDIVRGPDLAFMHANRAPNDADLDRYIDGGPDLAVEIVSPNDMAEDVRRLIDEYLQAGAQAVWIIYPAFKTVEIHRANGSMSVLRASDMLVGEATLPGFSTPVSALFD